MPKISATTKWLALGLSLAMAWALFLATSGHLIGVGELRPPDLKTFTEMNSTDYQWNLADLDGKPVSLAEFKGKPILLNIWGTYCAPCLTEMPSLAKLADNPRVIQSGAVIVCVATDTTTAPVKEFLKDKGWKMTFLHARSCPPIFLTDTLPATFVIAPDGRIVSTQIGAALWDDPSVIEYLEKLK